MKVLNSLKTWHKEHVILETLTLQPKCLLVGFLESGKSSKNIAWFKSMKDFGICFFLQSFARFVALHIAIIAVPQDHGKCGTSNVKLWSWMVAYVCQPPLYMNYYSVELLLGCYLLLANNLWLQDSGFSIQHVIMDVIMCWTVMRYGGEDMGLLM